MVSYRIAAVTPLLVMLQPFPASALEENFSTTLREAWTIEEGLGDVIVYVSDDFLRSGAPEPGLLHVVTILRSNRGHAANSVRDDVNRLHRYLRDHSSYGARDLVAVASSGELIRVYFRNRDLDPATFDHPNATLEVARPEDWHRLRSIDMADFARGVAKRATLQARAERQLLGDQVPRPEERTLQVRLRIPTASEEQGRTLVRLIGEQPFGEMAETVSLTADERHVDYTAKMRFSEAGVERLITGVCGLGSENGTPCAQWSGQFDVVMLRIAGRDAPLTSRPVP